MWAVAVQSLTIIAAGRITNRSSFSTISRRNLQISPQRVGVVVLADEATTWTSMISISNAMRDSGLSGIRSWDSKIAEVSRSSWI